MIEQLSKLRKSLLFIAAFLLTPLHITATNRDSLALTPPMGFMTWNKYKEDINEQLIRQKLQNRALLFYHYTNQ